MTDRLVKNGRYYGFGTADLAKRATKHDPFYNTSRRPFAADHARFSSCCLHPAACCIGCWTELPALSTKRLCVTGKATRGTVPAGQSDRTPGDFLPWGRSLTSMTQQWGNLRPYRSRRRRTHCGGIQGTHRVGRTSLLPALVAAGRAGSSKLGNSVAAPSRAVLGKVSLHRASSRVGCLDLRAGMPHHSLSKSGCRHPCGIHAPPQP